MARKQRKVITVEMGRQFRDCPACGYTDGFHNMFEKTEKPGLLKWYFICPQCSSTFDIGLTVTKDVKKRAK
jgi:transcription elongation factor Elf1